MSSCLGESRWTPLVPGTMFTNSINQQICTTQNNEMEDTSSSRSSFADLWNSSIPVEIRDDSIRRGAVYNPTSAVLQMCNRQVMAPYFFLLSVVGWRPLIRSTRWYSKLLNGLHTLVIIMLLFFSYVSSIFACQTRLDMSVEQPAVTPSMTTVHSTTVHPHNETTHPPTSKPNITSSSWIFPTIYEGTTLPTNSQMIVFNMSTMIPAKPEWSPTECTHIFSGYIVPNLLHFIAFLLGLYHFRIQESEGLQALIEMVFLQSRNQTKVVKRLRYFLIIGTVTLMFTTGTYILFMYSFGLQSVTGFRKDVKRQWVSCCFMVVGNLMVDCVTFVIILNFCAQCQLLVFYLRDIALRMEEKASSLDQIMKSIWNVKTYISHINGVAARITTMVVFNYCELTVLGLCILAMEPKQIPLDQLIYRVIVPIICFFTLTCPVIMGILLTNTGQVLKQLSLQMRVFGYPSTTQFDRDSFLLFVQHTNIEPKLFTVPMRASYVWGILTIIVFIVLLLMQTNILAGNNKYL